MAFTLIRISIKFIETLSRPVRRGQYNAKITFLLLKSDFTPLRADEQNYPRLGCSALSV